MYISTILTYFSPAACDEIITLKKLIGERVVISALIKRIFSLARPYKLTFLFAALRPSTAPVSILRPQLFNELSISVSLVLIVMS